MVEYTLRLDDIFGSLAHSTRRDMLRRLVQGEQSVGALAAPYPLTFAAVSKHVRVLEKARLIIKRRQGKEQMVRLSPEALAQVDNYLAQYRQLWEGRLDALETMLAREQGKVTKGVNHGSN
jgi:DNA-binding transcriptional ArsR family regulator